MALKRRSGNRFSANIWPGFVDAMTALLLVLMFVLTIFMIVQFVLRETITGQDEELNQLSSEIQGLASALGLEKRKNLELQGDVSALSSSLAASEAAAKEQKNLIDALTVTSEQQAARIAGFESEIAAFEAQVATLLSQNNALGADLRASRSRIAVVTGEKMALQARNKRLTQEISGQAAHLADLKQRNKILTTQVANQTRRGDELATLNQDLQSDLQEKTALAADLQKQNRQLLADAEQVAQDVAALEAQNRQLLADKDALERANLTVISEAEAMKLALVQARDEIDQSAQAARLAAAKAETLEAMLAEVRQEASDKEGSLSTALAALAGAEAELASVRDEAAEVEKRLLASQTALAETRGELRQTRTQLARKGLSEEELRKRVEEMAKGLTESEKAKLAEAAAAAALRARLKGAQDELTAMTLSLEVQRKAAEDTLTLLAAAETARKKATEQAQVELSQKQKTAALLAVANQELSKEKALSAEGRRKVALLNRQTVELRKQLDALQGLLDQSNARDQASKVQIETLGANLNAALAQVAAKQKKLAAEQRKLAEEQRARADLEEKERIRLEAETKDLKKFKSEFFGRLRDVLGAQDGIRIVGDRFVFSSEILFEAGSAELGERGRDEIRKVASTLFAVADQIPDGIDWVLRVDGHTDNTPLSGFGKYKDNWELSQARALSVVRYLINELGIPANRLAANGFGEFQPLVEGDSPEALAQNRRIELKFTEK